MRACMLCLHVDERSFDYCPNCGAGRGADLNRSGALVAIPAYADLPCQRCLERGRELKFRRYRRVIAFLFGASLQDIQGYFCASCRRRLFVARQLTTLVTGWWGLLSSLLYNPFAILLNFWALFRPPLSAQALGAISLDDLRAAADEASDLTQLYESLPLWVQDLSEEELDLIFADINYYQVLDLAPSASEPEVKAAFRAQAKRFHPDLGSPEASSNQMAIINDAYRVLSDPRTRYAYDHADELRAQLGLRSAVANGATQYEAPQSRPEECPECGIIVDGTEALVAHMQRFHGSPATVDGPRWCCRRCGAGFDYFHVASEHVERAHPDWVVIDPRTALEYR